MTTTNLPTHISRLTQLSTLAPTPFDVDATVVSVPGCVLCYEGSHTDAGAIGARWSLRAAGTHARLRDLVVA